MKESLLFSNVDLCACMKNRDERSDIPDRFTEHLNIELTCVMKEYFILDWIPVHERERCN